MAYRNKDGLTCDDMAQLRLCHLECDRGEDCPSNGAFEDDGQ